MWINGTLLLTIYAQPLVYMCHAINELSTAHTAPNTKTTIFYYYLYIYKEKK